MSPTLGDGDEPLGTGVLGDIIRAAHEISGDVTASARSSGLLRHSAQAGSQRPARERRLKAEAEAAARWRWREWEREQREAEAARIAAQIQTELEIAARQAELTQLLAELTVIEQARAAQDEEDVALLLLAA
jgi:hypothetical protein